jgi:hypothetical protein
MEPITYIFGGVVLTLISGIVGKAIGSNGKVKENTCGERRVACNKLVDERLHSMDVKLDIIIKALPKNNPLGI